MKGCQKSMRCLGRLNSILKEAWTLSQTDNSIMSDKIKALALAKECYAMLVILSSLSIWV